jgi:1,4-dihydroxy-2-naphthoate polyprenyltransferase
LRFHFSFFLLPVFLFSLSQCQQFDVLKAILIFFILHFLIYPSSNGYNSYVDRDTTPIGGLASPLQPTHQLLIITLVIDVLALVLSFFIGLFFAVGILLYIIASRAYSSRKVRLKKFPIIGFLTVFIFQGAHIFIIIFFSLNESTQNVLIFLPALISSLLIGALYPLTQVYQHKEDEQDGVKTISMALGKKGSFIFSMIFFILATFLFYILLIDLQNDTSAFLIYLLIMLPVVLFFLYWMIKVWKNADEANFRNSLRMNVLATFCTTLFFLILLIK